MLRDYKDPPLKFLSLIALGTVALLLSAREKKSPAHVADTRADGKLKWLTHFEAAKAQARAQKNLGYAADTTEQSFLAEIEMMRQAKGEAERS